MEEVLVKTHLIVTDVHDEYNIKWCGRILDAKPKFKNNKPIFTIVGGKGRMEVNSTDMKYIEDCAKCLASPKGRAAVTTDTARIYIVQEDDSEKLLGIVTQNHIKSYAPMYDKIGYR